MHPVLFEIALSPVTLAVIGLVFFVGGLIAFRFKSAAGDASYLASALGMHVRWGEVERPWGEAAGRAALNAAVAVGVAFALGKVAPSLSPGFEGIPLHVYGVMMATAFIVGIYISQRQAVHERLPPVVLTDARGKPLRDAKGQPQMLSSKELVGDLAFYLLLAGLAGSRVLYIITRWGDEYSRNPGKIFRIWEGGLVWYGGLIAATLVAVWFVRKHKISFLPYGDILVPGVALGHGIGRLGCFAAGCCFGNAAPEGTALAVQFPPGSPAFSAHLGDGLIHAGAAASAPVYPTQIMEAGAEGLIFFALLWIRARKRFHGQVLISYFGLYAVWRFINEMFRGDDIRSFWFKWPEGAAKPMMMSTSQGIAILMAFAALVILVVLMRKRGKVQPTADASSAQPV